MERLLNMIIRRITNRGINMGIRAASRQINKGEDGQGQKQSPNQKTPDSLRSMRSANRVLRRITRF